MVRHFTARGEAIDMSGLIAQNAEVRALGNARMNARGDILGHDGVVLKTQEQIEAEWAAEKAKQKLLSGRPSNIKAPVEQMVDPNKTAKQTHLHADKDFEPEITGRTASADQNQIVPEVQVTRRKIVETE